MSTTIRVVVIGGGYAGVTAANRLTQRDDVSVTLVNPRSTFVERIRLHQLVAGTDDAVVDFRDVLAPSVRLVVDSATRIDASERRVELTDGGTLDYDYLIYAVGSRSTDADVTGAQEHAFPVATLEEAAALRAALDGAGAGAQVVVVGAGPAGIETAAELAEQGRDVTLVCGGELGPYLHPRGRRVVARKLAHLGVTVVDGPGSLVTAVTPDAVELADGRVLRSAVTIWTAGFEAPDLATRSGLRTDAVGRLLTDETLTSVDDVRIVAAGDSGSPSDEPYRMSCQAAGQLGLHAADTVLARIAGRDPEPVGVVFLGQCLSLGRRAGLFQLSRRNDAAVPLYFGGGRAGAWLKELICTTTVKQLTAEARRPGAARLPSWAQDPTRAQRLATPRRHEPAAV
jgi:NADH dehydrogenase FAD-containing subunit